MSRIFALATVFALLLVATASAESLVQELSSLDKECAEDLTSLTLMRLNVASLVAATMVGGTSQQDLTDLRKRVDRLATNTASREIRLERIRKLYDWKVEQRPEREKRPLTFQGWWQALKERNEKLKHSLKSAQTLFQ